MVRWEHGSETSRSFRKIWQINRPTRRDGRIDGLRKDSFISNKMPSVCWYENLSLLNIHFHLWKWFNVRMKKDNSKLSYHRLWIRQKGKICGFTNDSLCPQKSHYQNPACSFSWLYRRHPISRLFLDYGQQIWHTWYLFRGWLANSRDDADINILISTFISNFVWPLSIELLC